ncbi:MAG: T9SS type A sorting domain-containing protein [Bacteroidota bacterium]
MFNRLLLSFVLLAIAAAPISAQNYLQHKIKKKTRTNLEQFVEYLQAHPDAKPGKVTPEYLDVLESRTDNDQVIDATAEAESELHAAINPTDQNNIIISAMRQDPSSFLSPLQFPTYYSKDFGETWQLSEFDGTLDGAFVVGGGDPIIVFDTEGTAYICWLTLSTDITLQTTIALRYAVSNDGGATWTEAPEPLDQGNAGSILDLLGGAGSPGLKFVDKEWLAVDRSNSSFRNNIYAAYLTIESEDGESITTNITLRKKDADTEFFTTESVQVNTDEYKLVQFTSIDVDNAGTVHVTFAGTPDSLNWSMYYTQSLDGGETFAQEKKVSDFHIPRLSGDEPESNIVGIDGQRLYPCPHVVVDKSGGDNDGNLYLVWTANGLAQKETEGLDIYYSRSTDGGNSWSEARVLNDNEGTESHQFYPSIAVNDLGTLVVSWYDRREDPNNLNTQYYMTYSEDGGTTFVEDFPVSTEASDFSMIGSKNGNFGIGEYTQTLATSEFAIPVWADGRTNDGNIDLYVAKVPLDGSGGVVNISTIHKDFAIEGPNPNPFSGNATFQVNLEAATDVQIQIHNLEGKLIRSLQAGALVAGQHTFELKDLAAGAYVLSVQTEKGFASKQLIVK